MITQRLRNATEILEYALKHDKSMTESCRIFERTDSYVRKTKTDFADKNDPDYIKFVNLYNKVVGKTLNIANKKPVEINEVLDSVELLNSDTVIEKEQIIKNQTGNTLEIDFRGNELITNADMLLEKAKVDMSVWKMDKKVVNKWDVTMMSKKLGEPIVSQNFQVKVWLSKIRTEDQQTAFNDFIKTIRENAPKFNTNSLSSSKGVNVYQSKKYLLELSLPDLHIGKLSWEDESGENYDTKIAIERYNESVERLLDHVKHYKNQISEILLPIGNDLFNIDNKNNMTTAGTPQHVDSRWQQMFMKAKGLLIKNINDLMQIAPVKVLMVSGNHDMQTVFYLGSVLEAYYRNTDKVTIDNSPTQRKYHSYGINLIGFTHGNEEKHQELGLIMATEKPMEWAASKCRQFHLGHFHSRKTTKYLDVQEFQGFTVRVLPSLSGTDAWHNSKGYMSMKSAVAYLYDKDNGLVAEFSHNII
jgi:hypothetical protein